MNDKAGIKSAIGMVKIRDRITGEVIRDVQNAVHFGNISMSIAKALAGDSEGHIRWLALGNGGSSLNESGFIDYRVPNVSEFRDESAALYNETYAKDVQLNNDRNYVEVILSSVNFADIKVVATLDFGEPAGQDLFDNATSVEGEYIFDELGLKINDGTSSEDSTLITHVVFHPVQKSLNRSLEIEYTLRIQMG